MEQVGSREDHSAGDRLPAGKGSVCHGYSRKTKYCSADHAYAGLCSTYLLSTIQLVEEFFGLQARRPSSSFLLTP
ncbi:unnamed protein product [Ilex paraguariensis]|uniref:Uncharacterized protein n=1 Tax=Ilex paraguariensis TaxID=185542 RepID=A0ABC8THU5_9AQUA